MQVEKDVTEAKPDGCLVLDLVYGLKSKGARCVGRTGTRQMRKRATQHFFVVLRVAVAFSGLY